MTISSSIRQAGPFTGNGTASAFPFAFKVFEAADLEVFRTLASTGVVTTLSLNTDYTVTLNLDQNVNPGGTVTLVAGPLATGTTLLIVSDVAETQNVDLTNQGGFYPEVINDALDRATILNQQSRRRANRSIRVPDSETGFVGLLPKVADRANQYLAFDSNGRVDIGGAVPDQRYYGEKTADPATRNDGSASQAGDLYFNSVSNVMKVYNGSAWDTVTTTPVDGDKGDITLSGGASTYTIDNDVVTFAKMANIATDRLVGRDTASTGDPEALTVGGGIEFTGSGGIQTSAFTGDVTKSAGGTALTIANGAVTSAKLDTNIDIAGTLDVTGVATFDSTTTFTGAPSYAADPSGANVLSRKSYVDNVYRVGATKIVKVDGANTGIAYETGGTTFSITGQRFRCPAGQTWEGTRMDVAEGARTVTSSSDAAINTVANAVYVFVRTA